MRPDPLQSRGWEIAKTLMLDEEIPFDGYVMFQSRGLAWFRLYLGERSGKLLTIMHEVAHDTPIKVTAQAISLRAKEALQ